MREIEREKVNLLDSLLRYGESIARREERRGEERRGRQWKTVVGQTQVYRSYMPSTSRPKVPSGVSTSI
jgi:hypothetical protein